LKDGKQVLLQINSRTAAMLSLTLVSRCDGLVSKWIYIEQ